MAGVFVRNGSGLASLSLCSAVNPWRRVVVGFVLFSVLAVHGGCRSVWRHSDATQAMFDRDIAACRYGIEPYEPGAYESAVSGGAGSRRGWKRCMAARGWSTTTGSRDSAPWARMK
jgi:hypothetical protein